MYKDIKEYWEDRPLSNPNATTTNDIYFRELEINTIIDTIKEFNITKGKILDIGCGDGYAIMKMAKIFLDADFTGLDYSKSMINNANKMLESNIELKKRVKFINEDIMNIESVLEVCTYDIIISDRCLINLGSKEKQYYILSKISKYIKPNGCYIAIENFIEGQNNMNDARNSVNLQDIPIRWHNIYFEEDEFLDTVRHFFRHIKFKNFASSYYFATRVIYSAICKINGQEPDYYHDINKLAISLPWCGQFSPVRMVVMIK